MRSSSPRSLRLSPIAMLAAAVCATCLTIIGASFGARFSDNFDVVEPGLAYRSGQLSPGALEAVVQQRGIRSIINLSPPQPDRSWYRYEVTLSKTRHVARYEMPLSPRRELTSAELCRLLALLQKAPKPVLIHSRNGADRTGLAAAIFRYAIAARSIEEAEGQFSIWHGHLPYLVGGTGAMDASFQRFLHDQQAGPTTES